MVRGPEGPPQSEESRTLDSANSTPAPQRLAGLPRLRLSAPGSPAGSGVERGVMSVLSLLIECVELKAQALISPGRVLKHRVTFVEMVRDQAQRL